MIKRHHYNQGFTLIEMIVSLGIFSIIITTAVGALLVLISANQKLQGEQSAMTNISFALDSMTREIRTGFNYYCVEHPNNLGNGSGAIFNSGVNNFAHGNLLNGTRSCSTGRSQAFQGVSFIEGGNSITGNSTTKRILYFYNADEFTLMRKVGNNAPQSIISSGIEVTDADFYVTGTDKLTATEDFTQPTVTIYLKFRESSSNNKEYYLQTTVTQRILDL